MFEVVFQEGLRKKIYEETDGGYTMYRIIEHKIKHQFSVYEYSRAASKHYGRPEWIRVSGYYYRHENALRTARLYAEAALT